jgi:hypothetical protein
VAEKRTGWELCETTEANCCEICASRANGLSLMVDHRSEGSPARTDGYGDEVRVAENKPD